MEIITGHINVDFDCLASMIAASKLYPHAVMVLPGAVGKEVREFLNLYRDSFDLRSSKEIDIDKIKRIIIVDTHSRSRMEGAFAKLVKRPDVDIIVYDHHPLCEDMVEARIKRIEGVGANTTLLAQEIESLNIEISALEATVMALGIYFDTNCLTFSGTTYKDAHALAFLLSKGANLQVIENYVTSHLTKKQQELLEKLRSSIKINDVNGFKIALSTVEIEEYVDDAAYLTRKLLEEGDLDAFFSILRMDNKTYIIGRSLVDEVDVGRIMGFFDGGGHPGAGSAKISEGDLDKISLEVLNALKENVGSVTRAKDIMSSPVKTIADNSTIDELNKIILRYGHSGLPVVKEDKLCGIISRRDIEKARLHGFGSSPVKAYMSKNVITINADTPIKKIQHLMVEHNIGRLPVVRGNELIGIVTRTDIIRILFGENSAGWYKKNYIDNQSISSYKKHSLSDRINTLPEKVRKILIDAGRTADEEGCNIYVVGGFVRDLILDVENFDIDIVVEGNAIHFAQKFAGKYVAELTTYEKFNTALVVLEDDFKIDIVTARKEYYEYPAALPVVESGTIKDDLFRRDFTINSMAIKLNKSGFGSIVDFYGGRKDLQRGAIRILYNLSFIEDPTRILRAIRFEQRYGFKMEEKTEEFAVKAIESGVLDEVSRERISFEFFAMLKERNIFAILERMQELSLLNKIFPEIMLTDDIKKLLKNKEEDLAVFQNSLNHKEKLDKILIYLLIIHSNMDVVSAEESSKKMRLTKEQREEVLKLVKSRDNILTRLSGNIDICDYDVYNKLKGLSTESLFVLSMLGDERVVGLIVRYINDLKSIKTCLTGKELKELGVKPGPEFGTLLERVLVEKIKGNVDTYEEELKFLKEILKEK